MIEGYDEQATAVRYLRYKSDPWAFLTECVFTLDQVDKDNPIKLFPNKKYLKYYVDAWEKYPLMSVPKSRRLTISWTTIGLYVWDTIFHMGRKHAFVSKKEDDAHELVMRAKHIIDHIPEDRIPRKLVPRYHDKFCSLEFPDIMSEICGYPQGADQLRQFTFSGIFGDECAFWEQAVAFYSASFPTIDGGGRMTLVSSPAPGFFKRLIYDALDARGDISVSEYAPNAKQLDIGVRMWINEKNKFCVLELHYTADEDKRDSGYSESMKSSMPIVNFMREYELSWDTFAGYPVYPEFNKAIHVIDKNILPQYGLPLLRGWDFGLQGACVVAQMQGDTLFILREYTTVNKGTEALRDFVIGDLAQRYPEWANQKEDFFDYGDPAGMFDSAIVSDKAMNTHARILAEKGIMLRPGPVNWEARRQGVLEYLTKLGGGGAKLQIVGRNCPILVKGFEGGYRFSDSAAEVEQHKLRPIKDEFSHPQDALQYLCHGVTQTIRKITKAIPRPAYSITVSKAEQ